MRGCSVAAKTAAATRICMCVCVYVCSGDGSSDTVLASSMAAAQTSWKRPPLLYCRAAVVL
jgi:hypothetical protein